MEGESPPPPLTPKKPPACPGAPKKRSLKALTLVQDDVASDRAFDCIREELDDLEPSQRRDVLQHVSRHLLEPLFVAYLDWRRGRPGSRFPSLLPLVPDLAQQMELQITRAFPLAAGDYSDSTAVSSSSGGGAVDALVFGAAALSPAGLQARADTFVLSLSQSARKALQDFL